MWLLIFEAIQEKFPVRSHAGLLKSPPTGGLELKRSISGDCQPLLLTTIRGDGLGPKQLGGILSQAMPITPLTGN